MSKSQLDNAHEAILAEFRDFKASGMAHDPDARREHMARLHKLTDAKMKIVDGQIALAWKKEK